MFTKLIGGKKHSCEELYSCCSCGRSDEEDSCGCRYCFSCHACGACLSDDDNAVCELTT